MPAHHRSNLVRGGTLVWLVEVEYAGRLHRWASLPLTLDSDDGELTFFGELGDVQFAETMDRLSTSVSAAEVSIELLFPVNLIQAHRRGHHLQGALATVASVVTRGGVPVTAYEGRVVHLAGEVSQPQYGDPERHEGWAAFTIVGSAAEDVARLLSPAARMGPDTWSSTDGAVTDNHGKPYPIIIGAPGQYLDGGELRRHGVSPAYPVEFDSTPGAGVERLLIAGHHVTETTVGIAADDEPMFFASAENTADNLGHAVAVVDITGASAGVREANSYRIAWYIAVGHGLYNNYGPGGLRGFGDVLRWALAQSSIPIDHGAFRAAAFRLNAYKIDTFINDPDAAPWDWLQPILELLPITIRRGPAGLYPILHDTGAATPADAVSITAGPDFRRFGPVQVERDTADLTTEITIEFAPRSGSQDYGRVLHLSGSAQPQLRGERSTAYSRIAASRHGPRRETVSTHTVYDEATAAAILRDLVRERSSVVLTLEYEADPSWGWLPLGGAVALTDAGMFYTDQLGEIAAKRWSGTRWLFSILFLLDSARDNRA
jgi:hypothetical protein